LHTASVCFAGYFTSSAYVPPFHLQPYPTRRSSDLPASPRPLPRGGPARTAPGPAPLASPPRTPPAPRPSSRARAARPPGCGSLRSEEHTSELQSRFDLVCRLLLENINS